MGPDQNLSTSLVSMRPQSNEVGTKRSRSKSPAREAHLTKRICAESPSDSTDMDIDRAIETPHDAPTESLPKKPFHTEKLQNSLKVGVSIAEKSLSILEQIFQMDDHSTIQELQKRAKDLSTYHMTESQTIAFLGDSGEGRYLRCDLLIMLTESHS
jgi:hypothetical protein